MANLDDIYLISAKRDDRLPLHRGVLFPRAPVLNVMHSEHIIVLYSPEYALAGTLSSLTA